jgi:hypothetical protein
MEVHRFSVVASAVEPTGPFEVRLFYSNGTFEKRALRRIFGPNREEVAGGWRRLHSEGIS